MLILNEGPPRAGKSYDAVKTHILPALKAGRRVYARLNGLDHEKIAEYLQLPTERVRELLTVIAHKDVVRLLTCFGDDPPKFQMEFGALVVIDEVHDFYVSSRQALPHEQEAFFAKHGHIGLDVLIMTQSLGRLHSSIRQRIERKCVFTKLNALGKSESYAVRFYSVGDQMGKFIKISSETHEYDPAIYPLYHGFQPGVENTAAYTGGAKNVWDVVRKPAIAMAAVTVLGIVGIGAFFSGGGVVDESAQAIGPKEPAKPVPGAIMAQPDRAAPTPAVVPGIAAKPRTAAPAEPEKKRDAGIAHVLDLTRSARPRYGGTIGRRHVLEWRTAQGQAVERLTSDELEALGWSVVRTGYGVKAQGDGETIVFTAWPIMEPVFTVTQRQAESWKQPGGSGLDRASGQAQTAPASLAGTLIAGEQMHGYGDLGSGAAPVPADG